MTGLVVLNYNSSARVKELFDKISAYRCFDRIALVDNASEQGDLDALWPLQSEKTKILPCRENLGYARGNNVGLRWLVQEGCSVCFLANPDVSFAENAVTAVVEALDANIQYGAIAPRILNADGSPALLIGEHVTTFGETLCSCFFSETRVIYRAIRQPSPAATGLLEQTKLMGSFFAITSKALEDIGYLDENTFLYREEEILGWRLRNAGYREAVLADVHYLHLHEYRKDPIGQKLRSLRLVQQSDFYLWCAYGKINRIQRFALRAAYACSRVLHAFAFCLQAKN